MNENFYRNKFASEQYGNDAYDAKALLSLLDLENGFNYLEAGVGTGRFLVDFITIAKIRPGRICAADLENNLEIVGPVLSVPVQFDRIQLGTKALPYASSSFDLVVCNHVLEHIFETEAALRELLRVTVSGGHCVVSVPNIANWWSRFTFLLCGELPIGLETGTESATDGLACILRHRFHGFKPSGHIRGFTPRALRDLCERCGFQFVGWWNQNFGWQNKLMKPKIGIVLRKK